MKADHADAADRCPACGGPVGCGVADGEGTCWCFALPPVMPMPPDASGSRCYCRSCLERLIAEATTARAPRGA